MKKRFTILLAMLLMLICAAASAQEYYTLPELREQASAGWHETYTDKYGRETTVGIDVQVFGEDKAPVLKVGWHDYTEYIASAGDVRATLKAAKKRGGTSTYVYDSIHGMKIDMDEKYGEEYGNDLTLREVYAIFDDVLSEKGISSAEFLYEQPEKFSLVCSINQKTGIVIDPAFYSLRLWSTKYGLPILTHVSDSHKESGYPWYVPSLTMELRSQDEYSICDRSFKTQEILAEDIPLCSLNTVIHGIEVMIEKGYIQDVFSMRFGYAVYNDPTISSDKPVSAYDAQCYYLVPSWVIECGISDSPKKDYEDYHESMIRTITINAQTGKMIDYFDTSKTGYGDADYKGFISWDGVQ